MTPLAPIAPTYRVLLGDITHFNIMVVGLGGTGSALALALAGLVYHARQKGIGVKLTLVDHDVIKPKNVGRQQFCPAEANGGIAKASSLALRLNAAYGLDITAWPLRFQASLASDWFCHKKNTANLLIGCVDTHLGRQEMAKAVTYYSGRWHNKSCWSLDCGNAYSNGQILIGNATQLDTIRFDRLGLCTGFPSPYLQEPTLLEPEEVADATLSCADLTLRDEQSLMVNRLTAAIAAQYVTDFVLQRQATQLGTFFNLTPTVMRPRLATKANILLEPAHCEIQHNHRKTEKSSVTVEKV